MRPTLRAVIDLKIRLTNIYADIENAELSHDASRSHALRIKRDITIRDISEAERLDNECVES